MLKSREERDLCGLQSCLREELALQGLLLTVR